MAEQSKLEQIGITQRGTLIPFNFYNNVANGNGYSATHTRAKSDTETPVAGKGTGSYMDTSNGGGSLDVYGSSLAVGSGRLGNLTFNHYNQNAGYEHPDTSGNVGQVHW
jgi:hypothetical protein